MPVHCCNRQALQLGRGPIVPESSEPTFECTKCGSCCRGFDEKKAVVVFPEDISGIAVSLNITDEVFIKEYCNPLIVETDIKRLELHTLKHSNSNCIFLGSDNLCKIYYHRPIQCQRAPFFFFWSGKIDFEYQCTKNVKIPEGWSSKPFDQPLLRHLFED
jgi:Fe-S-cluster containining protein